MGSMSKGTDVIILNGVKVMITHGDQYNVKYGIETAKTAARAAKCKVLLFGHTHEPMLDYEDGLYIMNPGSLHRSSNGKKTYGVLEIKNGQILTNIASLPY